MAFDRVTAEQRSGKGVTDLPDTPNMTAAELQARFDSLANLAIDALNLLMAALEASTAASNIGTSEGTLQSWMGSCESAVSRNTSNIEKVQNSLTNLAQTYYSTDKVPYTLNDLKSRTVALEDATEQLDTATTTNFNNINNNAKKIENINHAVNDHDERISDNETNIDTLKASVGAKSDTLPEDTLWALVKALQDDRDDTNDRVTTAEDNITSLQQSTEDTDRVARDALTETVAIKKTIGDEKTVDTILYDLNSAMLAANEAQNNSENNAQDISDLQTDVSELQNKVGDLREDNDGNIYSANDITAIYARLKALEGGTTS